MVGVRRIAVVGCGGSGKTYLARRLGAQLGLPVTHLDALYYGADWTPASAEEFARAQRELVAGPVWVIDGNYASTMSIRLQAADTVLVLDLPVPVCLAGITARRLRYRGGQHADDGVYDRVTWSFIRYICTYRRIMRPRVRHLVDGHADHAQLIILSSRRQVHRFLHHTAAAAAAGM